VTLETWEMEREAIPGLMDMHVSHKGSNLTARFTL
jgi:hypothetical protein